MKQTFTTSFDELIRNYYGNPGNSPLKDTVTLEELFANYYGVADDKKRKIGRPGLALSLCRDDGEILLQTTQPYAVGQSLSTGTFEEYVVGDTELAFQSSLTNVKTEANSTSGTGVFEEYAVDVLAPLEESSAPATPRPEVEPPRQPSIELVEPVTESPASRTDVSQAKATDEDFMADMQSILTGQKVFDPLSKKTVEKDKLGAPTPSANTPPLPETSNSQAIFDRIARSMQYANAYDLGTVELENRFADFDRISELQQNAAQEKKVQKRNGSETQPVSPTKVDSEDFIQDLDAIRREHYGSAEAEPIAEPFSVESEEPTASITSHNNPACIPFTLSLEDRTYSKPLYDAGEHVLPAKDLYANQLRVGRNPGVMFSYGHLLAMGDLYANVDEMMNASVAELEEIRSLIQQNTRYYEKERSQRKSYSSLDVSNERWDQATGGRYLELAEENYDHFSPNVIFSDAIAKAANKKPTNKSTWEAYHERAIREAQRMWLDPKYKNVSFFPEWPLIINAFGDHFLTDAFAAGHLINKEVTIAYFKANFFAGGTLKPASEKFFARVAELAFVGDVKKKFKVLETSNYPVCKWGWCVKWHPNIDSESMFRRLLIEAATQEPDKVANFAVKALHDRLNEDGLTVTNLAGEKPWPLTGDGFLNIKSLEVMRRAVQQSVDNIVDPSIQASNLNFGAYFAKVWKHVPQLTPASKEKVIKLMKDYTTPESTVLSTAAASLVRKQVDSMIKVLLKEGKLKAA